MKGIKTMTNKQRALKATLETMYNEFSAGVGFADYKYYNAWSKTPITAQCLSSFFSLGFGKREKRNGVYVYKFFTNDGEWIVR